MGPCGSGGGTCTHVLPLAPWCSVLHETAWPFDRLLERPELGLNLRSQELKQTFPHKQPELGAPPHKNLDWHV